jgi:hypothetical protein
VHVHKEAARLLLLAARPQVCRPQNKTTAAPTGGRVGSAEAMRTKPCATVATPPEAVVGAGHCAGGGSGHTQSEAQRAHIGRSP